MKSDATTRSLTVTSEDAGKRLDAFVAGQVEGWSRSRLASLIANEDVLVNERPAKNSYKVRTGDEIDLDLVEQPAALFEPEDIPLDIVFEDEYLAVINKPAGMVVHPGAGVTSGTLANAIAYHYAQDPADGATPSNRVGIVHRLDKDTSGLIVIAKDEDTSIELSRQFHDREVEKSYIALVHGELEYPHGTIDKPIARDKHNRLKMRVANHGRNALSLWRVRESYEKFTLLDVDIKTGRTHQIRVHLASINHPVVGDENYNSGRDKTVANMEIRRAIASLGRFFLHAHKLSFTHPQTGNRMRFKQELATELAEFLDVL